MPVPEKITIDGKEYVIKDHPELLSMVQEVRKEEKDKLMLSRYTCYWIRFQYFVPLKISNNTQTHRWIYLYINVYSSTNSSSLVESV